MEIRIPKTSCSKCKSSNIKTSSNNTYYECNNCGYDDSINIVWEEDPLFCNCKTCKQLNIDKDNK